MDNGLQSMRNDMQIAPAAMQANTALAQVEQSRAVAEVQASLVLARANPRNEQSAEYRIMQSCKRKSLAECASYSFRRGGEMVTGATIRLAEEIARHWGNMQYGFREVGRLDDCSEVEAFAYDLETNVRVTRQFQVRHWRDTKSGGKKITEERDKYELVANMAQRRVRACLLELIPGDIVEAAEEACKATLIGSIGDPAAKAGELVAAFKPFGVTEEMIEGYLQRKLTSIVPADIVNLKRIYRSIKDGIADVDEFFKADDVSKLNERFGKKQANAQAPPPSKHVEKPEATPPETPKHTSAPPSDRQAQHRQQPQQTPPPPEDPGPQEEPQGQTVDAAEKDQIISEIPPKVKAFMREINAATEGGSIAVDTWRMKHHNRAANALGGAESPLFKQVMEYADQTYKGMLEAEADQKKGGKSNGSLF